MAVPRPSACAWLPGPVAPDYAQPFLADRYFIILPIVGLLSGVRAIQRGRPTGGAVGAGVNVLGGLVSPLASGLIGG